MSLPVMPLKGEAEWALYHLIEQHILTAYPDVTVRHTKTQTAFARKVQFCWVTPPLRRADAGSVMLYIALPFHLESPRVLRTGYPSHDRYMHHILLRSAAEFDAEITGWIEAAWALVGPGRR
ncbi:MAG: hypothetical protein IJB81_08670 [Clostridia bacterium]|nr:hypothetical protein [Clostridia bacterium]